VYSNLSGSYFTISQSKSLDLQAVSSKRTMDVLL
jgi:hypothetical protein